MIAYVFYVERPQLKNYLATFALFILGMMAKPMLVTLPFVMLLMDYWPLQRFEPKKSVQEIRTEASKLGAGTPASDGVTSSRRKSGGKREPLSADKRKGKSANMRVGQDIAQSSVLVTPEVLNPGPQSSPLRSLLIEKIPFFALIPLFSVLTYTAEGEAVKHYPMQVRISNALVSYFIYTEKMIWPTNLAVFYPHPGLRPPWQVVGVVLLSAL